MMEYPYTTTSGPSEIHGVVHPAETNGSEPTDLCVVILNSGMTHRVGPHRLGVRLARRLAERGIPAARFDFSGVGNSDTRTDGASLKDQWVSQCYESMDLLEKDWGYKRFVMIGLCGGGQVSFGLAARDERVVGAVLLNTRDYELEGDWEQYANQERDARFYWSAALRRKGSWKRLLTGKSSFRKIGRAVAFKVGQLFRPSKTLTDAKDWFAGQMKIILDRGTCLLILFSKGDPGWDQLRLLLGQKALKGYSSDQMESQVCIQVIPDADHTFTMRHSQETVLKLALDWVEGFEQRLHQVERDFHTPSAAEAQPDSAMRTQ